MGNSLLFLRDDDTDIDTMITTYNTMTDADSEKLWGNVTKAVLDLCGRRDLKKMAG